MDLPVRCDVAVVGGGLTGLLAADRLQAAGAQVVLFDGAPGPVAGSQRSLGIVGLGWLDSPARLTSGLGERTARGLVAWSSLAIESLARTAEGLGVSFIRSGSLRACLDDGEAAEWRESARLLREWGLGEAREVSPGELASIAPEGQLVTAVHVPGDGAIDVAALCAGLRGRFLAQGGHLVPGYAVSLGEVRGAPVALFGEAELPCELVVVAGGPSAPTVHPFFRSCIYPVRLQAQRVQGGGAQLGESPVIARHRFEAWQRDGDDLLFVGCRWGEQPEMEAGVMDDTAVSTKVSTRQDEFLASRLGIGLDANRTRWSGIVAYTCDGLPILGPLPGAPKVLGLVGWSGWGLSLLPRAVDEITAAMLGEPPPDGVGTPSWLVARRLI